MREIKFRALSKPCTLSASMGLKPKMVYGTGIFKDPVNTWLCSHNEAFCMAHDMLNQIVYPETVGQYTGLKDKNSVEIYEGDILNVVCNWDSAHMQVLWEGSQFVLKTYDAIGFKVLDVMNNIEVIGNIHESEDTSCN